MKVMGADALSPSDATPLGLKFGKPRKAGTVAVPEMPNCIAQSMPWSFASSADTVRVRPYRKSFTRFGVNTLVSARAMRVLCTLVVVPKLPIAEPAVGFVDEVKSLRKIP